MRRTGGNGAKVEEAARRFVGADSGGRGQVDTELATWLAADPANERALTRVELAVELGRRLAAEPSSPLYLEARAAAGQRRRGVRLSHARAWGSALAAGLVIAALLVLGRGPEHSKPPPLAMEAARRIAFDAPNAAVAVLPNGAVVDAGAVAVLPFAGAADASLAAGLEQDIVAALRTVPGLYVIADAAVRPYANTELAAAELGGLLSARGLVDGSVELVDGRVRVSARLREAATGATLWQTEVDQPVDELRAVRSEIAEHVAAAMFDSSLRAQVQRSSGSGEPLGSAKPFRQ